MALRPKIPSYAQYRPATTSIVGRTKNQPLAGAAGRRVKPTLGVGAPPAPGVAPVPAANPPAQADPSVPDTDSIYTADAAKLLFRNQDSIRQLGLAQQRDQGDFDESTRRLAIQRTQALQNANEGANKQGLFYSGQLSKRRDQLETGYNQQSDDMLKNFQRTRDDRQTAIDQINSGQPLDLEGFRQDALQRILARRSDQVPAPEGTTFDSNGTTSQTGATFDSTGPSGPAPGGLPPLARPRASGSGAQKTTTPRRRSAKPHKIGLGYGY